MGLMGEMKHCKIPSLGVPGFATLLWLIMWIPFPAGRTDMGLVDLRAFDIGQATIIARQVKELRFHIFRAL